MKNFRHNRKAVSPLWLLPIVIIIIAGIGVAVWYNESQRMADLESHFKHDGLKIVTGYSNSPTIVQTTQDYYEFVDICHNINQTIIYKVAGRAYMVIANETYGCEYYAYD